jgi:hypothetical protein
MVGDTAGRSGLALPAHRPGEAHCMLVELHWGNATTTLRRCLGIRFRLTRRRRRRARRRRGSWSPVHLTMRWRHLCRRPGLSNHGGPTTIYKMQREVDQQSRGQLRCWTRKRPRRGTDCQSTVMRVCWRREVDMRGLKLVIDRAGGFVLSLGGSRQMGRRFDAQ